MNSIFISYSRTDRGHADRVASLLRSRMPGFDFFLDDASITKKENCKEQFEQIVKQYQLIICIWSRQSVLDNDFVGANSIAHKEKKILPFATKDFIWDEAPEVLWKICNSVIMLDFEHTNFAEYMVSLTMTHVSRCLAAQRGVASSAASMEPAACPPLPCIHKSANELFSGGPRLRLTRSPSAYALFQNYARTGFVSGLSRSAANAFSCPQAIRSEAKGEDQYLSADLVLFPYGRMVEHLIEEEVSCTQLLDNDAEPDTVDGPTLLPATSCEGICLDNSDRELDLARACFEFSEHCAVIESAFDEELFGNSCHGQKDTSDGVVDLTYEANKFRGLFSTFGPKVKAMLLRQGADSSTAEEIVNETMLSVWSKRDLFQEDRGGISTWIYAIARNLRLDHVRRRVDFQAAMEMRPLDSTHRNLDCPNGNNGLLISQLTREQLEIVKLSFVEGCSQSEIAERLSVSPSSVRQIMKSAYAKLNVVGE